MLHNPVIYIDRESQKKRRKFTFLKRRSLPAQPPSNGKMGNTVASNVRGIGRQASTSDTASGAENAGRPKRRRKKSSRKNIALASPSSDETAQGMLMALLFNHACKML